MKFQWFVRRGLFFLPVAWPGWVIVLGMAVYAVCTFREIDSHSHSVSDTLINFVFQMLLVGAAYSLLAFFTSPSERSSE